MPKPTKPTLSPYTDQLPDVNNPATWADRTPLFWNWVTGDGYTNMTDALTYSDNVADYLDTALADSETLVDSVSGMLAGTTAFDALLVNGPVTGTGVTQSDTDTTSGRLLKVGDAGINDPQIGALDDLDNFPGFTRLFGWNSSTGGSPANGPGAQGHSGLQIGASNTRLIQLAGKTQGSENRLYYRSRNTDWNPWVELFHERNIVGTVSQSAGIPTGAVIETGSNSNGEYTRFADGMQICSHETPVTTDTTYISHTFPAEFVVGPNVIASCRRVGGDSVQGSVTVGPIGSSFVSLRMTWHNGSGFSLSKMYLAIGRWY